jgi:hypothetical protein
MPMKQKLTAGVIVIVVGAGGVVYLNQDDSSLAIFGGSGGAAKHCADGSVPKPGSVTADWHPADLSHVEGVLYWQIGRKSGSTAVGSPHGKPPPQSVHGTVCPGNIVTGTLHLNGLEEYGKVTVQVTCQIGAFKADVHADRCSSTYPAG